MRILALEIKMTDKTEQDTERSKQAVRPIFWVIGFVTVILALFAVYQSG
jgi:hypothetical protein